MAIPGTICMTEQEVDSFAAFREHHRCGDGDKGSNFLVRGAISYSVPSNVLTAVCGRCRAKRFLTEWEEIDKDGGYT